MADRYALLLDGGFVRKRLRQQSGESPDCDRILAESQRIQSLGVLRDLKLLRTYFYDAPPATGVLQNPLDGTATNLGRTPLFETARALHDALELADDVALRMGEIVVRGWWIDDATIRTVAKLRRSLMASDLRPDVEQKGVDLRIGLDIARLSLRRLVDVLVVVTGDSDLVPAFKFARREGLRVYLDHLGAPVRRGLRAHVDRVL